YFMASEDALPLGVEPVCPAGNRASLINQTRPRLEIEQWANDRSRQPSRFPNALASLVSHPFGQFAESLYDRVPFICRHHRHRRQPSTAMVTALPAWPVATGRRNLADSPRDCVLNLVKPAHAQQHS